MDLSKLGSLGDLAKQMQDAYGEGMSAMDKAGEQVAASIKPDHEIEVDIKLSAKVEGHDYQVDAKVIFEIELKPIFQAADSPAGDLSSLLDGLDVDLGDDKGKVMEQLGQPRAVGVVKKITCNKLEVSDKKGKAKVELNKKGTLLATLSKGKLKMNFGGVFSYPGNTDVFAAIPSMEVMQKNIVVDVKNIKKEISFKWEEKDKDNLKVSGKLKIRKL